MYFNNSNAAPPPDYMVRHSERILMKGMGLSDHPHLRDIYFVH